jgi:hypothetical protein
LQEITVQAFFIILVRNHNADSARSADWVDASDGIQIAQLCVPSRCDLIDATATASGAIAAGLGLLFVPLSLVALTGTRPDAGLDSGERQWP